MPVILAKSLIGFLCSTTLFLYYEYFYHKHLQGKENRVVDALSRKVQNLYEISISGWKSPFWEMIKESTDQDAEYQQLKHQLQ